MAKKEDVMEHTENTLLREVVLEVIFEMNLSVGI